jgi:hypothetical protein
MVMDENPISWLETFHLTSHSLNNPGWFVAEGTGSLPLNVPRHHIPATDTTRFHPDKGITGTNIGDGHIFYTNVIEIVDSGDLHFDNSPFFHVKRKKALKKKKLASIAYPRNRNFDKVSSVKKDNPSQSDGRD